MKDPTAGRWFVAGAGILGAAAVALGALHAHGMDKWLGAMGLGADEVAYRMEIVATGLRYQMTHAVAILAIGLALRGHPGKLWRLAMAAMVTGVLLFSGSLYGIALTGVRALGAIAPLGGLGLIVGWLCVIAAGLRTPRPQSG